jgi:protoporphyrin/coproporphyrin ferrochelatase
VNQAVLLLAHGAPERLEDIEPYLAFVRGGRPSNPRVTEEVARRYAAIGGGSPLLRWTRAQAEALERLLGMPVFFAMRNWHPFIQEVVPRIEAGRVAAVCLAPQYSEMSIGLYIRKVTETAPPFEVRWARSYHDEPLLIQAFAERLGQSNSRVLFTAHSLPERAPAADDPYDRECRATAALVARRLGLNSWDFAYQSQGMTGDRWLGPTVESCLDRYAAEGIREVVIAPIGFVCDHVEILYDIDIQFRDYAAARGITVCRPESLNDSPSFTAALGEVVRRCLT